MFLDIPADYTSAELKYGEDIKPNILTQSRRFADYTKSSIVIFESRSYYTSIVKHSIVPAPEGLKRAMFRASSKGIAEALS